MTVSEITARIARRLDDDPTTPSSTTPSELLAVVNEGQELASILTLCFEATVPFTIAANSTYLQIRPQLPDYIVPLRLTLNGVRIRPANLKQLDAANEAWESVSGDPARYAALGFNILAVTPQPLEEKTAQLTYAQSPVEMVGDDFPQLPEEYHPALVSYGIYRIKLKEGAQGLERGMTYFNDFLDEMTRLGDWVRAKSKAADHDTLPPELALFDRSALVLTI